MYIRFLAILPLAGGLAACAAYVVPSDRGGSLADRLLQLEALQRSNVRIEIRGKLCYSTCTMYLGLPGTCVVPETIFGFHGPSRNGQRLAQEDFDYFSRLMADYYPAPLADWFMAEGRYTIRGVHKMTGAEMIRRGMAEACA